MKRFISASMLILMTALVPLNLAKAQNPQLADKFPGADAGAKIAAAIAALPTTGGTVDARGLQGDQVISSNFFQGVSKAGKLLLGAGTYTIKVQLAIPSNWEIAGAGQQTVIKAANGLMLKNPEGMLVNSNMGNYTATSGHNTGIVIHDLTIDGNAQGGTNVGCLIFRGADNTEIHSVRVVNFPHFGIDLRDGLNNSVHDSFADASHAPAPWHSFGGGVGRVDGIFRGNKFNHNQAVNGVKDFDSFDINGNQPTAVCEGNEISENTSENTPIGIFLDSCAKSVVNKNRIVGAGNTGIAVTSGRRLAQQNTITNNEISQAGVGILLGNQANANVVTGNVIETTAKEAILITDASQNQIKNNTLKGPGQNAPGTYSGVRITQGGPDYATNNLIQGNHILDVNGRMLYGVLIENAHGGSAFGNSITGNEIVGGQPGNTLSGVHDTAKRNSIGPGQRKPGP